MCNPALAVSIVSMVASTGLSMYGQSQAQKAANEQAKFRAAQARAEQDAALEQANLSLKQSERAQTAAKATRKEGERGLLAYIRRKKAMTTEIRQRFAAHGVFAEDESALEEVELQQEIMRGNEMAIYDNIEREATGWQQRSEDFVFESTQLRKGAQQMGLTASFYDQLSKGSAAAKMAASLAAGAGNIAGLIGDAQHKGLIMQGKQSTAKSEVGSVYSSEQREAFGQMYNYGSGYYGGRNASTAS